MPYDNSCDRTFLSCSRGLCRDCGKIVEARYVALNNSVYLERYCEEHGTSRALVAESLAFYLDALAKDPGSVPPCKNLGLPARPCPDACGPCSRHAQACHLPVFSITNACDLRCPICFTYNRSDLRYFMSEEEFIRQIDFVVESTGGVDLINITGGEPTSHPNLCNLLRHAKRPEIGRITVNSNGRRLGRDPELARQLADLGVYVILSLDTFDPERSKVIHGVDITEDKKRALEQLEKFNIPTTLLMVLIGGVNEDELNGLLDLTLTCDTVRSLTIQTMTYTGQGGRAFQPRKHIPVDGVVRRLADIAEYGLLPTDFVSLPSAHPLCYQVSYLLRGTGNDWLPFSRILGEDCLRDHFKDGYLIRPGPELELALKDAVLRLHGEGAEPRILAGIRSMLQRLYPTHESLTVHERQRRAEGMVKTIYAHAHMDEDTFEIGRAMRCPDQVPVDASRFIGACSYNLRYRKQDPRFWETP
jgi:7,8-dihydro-6-hydroxymethylpterin dimethyltransferase